jgi:hypothetical protein
MKPQIAQITQKKRGVGNTPDKPVIAIFNRLQIEVGK